jgi:hypothetical protein
MIYFLLLLFSPLLATDSSVSSSNADYDGNALHLTGNVLLDHGLGKMQAEEASLERQDVGKEFPFSLIHLRKAVQLHLKTSAELTCAGADLDFVALKGQLISKEGEAVSYLGPVAKKKGKQGALKITSQKAFLELAKKGIEGKKSEFDIHTLEADEHVTITYGEKCTLKADKALYRKNTFDHAPQEILTVTHHEGSPKCRLLREGDLIDADSIDYDLLSERLSLSHPKGALDSPTGKLLFTANHLLWDQAKQTLTLKGSVELIDSGLGTIYAPDELKLSQSIVKGKRVLESILTKGATTLTYNDGETEVPTSLTTHGSLKFNRERSAATLESPLVDGAIPATLQITYLEPNLAVYANKGSIEFVEGDTKLSPASIHLTGAVRLVSRDASAPARCALADRLSYFPDTRTVILAANQGKKVVFWDEEQTLRMSAQEIHITRDQARKDVVKGVGNVQFGLSVNEHQLLKKFFPRYQVPHAE